MQAVVVDLDCELREFGEYAFRDVDRQFQYAARWIVQNLVEKPRKIRVEVKFLAHANTPLFCFSISSATCFG